MNDYVSLPKAHSSYRGNSGLTPEESSKRLYGHSVSKRFLILSLVYVIAGLWIYHTIRDVVERAVTEVGVGEVFASVNTVSSSATVIVALMTLLGGWWLLEQNRQAKARERDEAASKWMTARLHFLTRHANDCIILCDASGRIIEANDRCFWAYGYSQDEWLKLNMNDVTPEGRFTLPGLVQQIPAERGVVYGSRHARKNGTVFDVEVRASLTEADGKSCYQLIIRDVSEQKTFLQKQEAYTRHLSDLARRLVNIQEEERLRIAGELHDQVGANLATINLNLRSFGKMMSSPDLPLLEGRLKETGALLTDTIFSVRNFCTELRPATLYYSGLAPALKELVQRVGRRCDMEVRFLQENLHERLPPQTESMLFRIAQEALTNCAKHSNARRVEVGISRQDGTVVMIVSDNGNGFNSRQPDSIRDGLGLLTMRERAGMIGGSLSIISSPGKGAQLRVVLDLAHERGVSHPSSSC